MQPPERGWTIRPATMADAALLERLIDVTARSMHEYSDAQLDVAIGSIFGLDRQLIRDQTYFAVEAGTELIACGGWSRRNARFGADRMAGLEAEALDPARDAARIRAFFVHPDWSRRGVGRALLAHCEATAAIGGFHRLELMATLPGVRLYAACGFTAGEPSPHTLPNGMSVALVPMYKALVPTPPSQ